MRRDSITADAVLAAIRPLVIVVDGFGTILDARGGAGGFFGWDPASLTDRNVLDFVRNDQVDEVATYFLSSVGESVVSAPMPMPFRITLTDVAGNGHEVDVIPTGCVSEGETWGWVAVLVPLALQSSNSRSLNAELAGRPRSEVRQRLTEELGYHNSWGHVVWYLIDLSDADVGTNVMAPRDEPGMAGLFRSAVRDGWEPWESEPDNIFSSHGSTTFFGPGVEPRQIPSALATELIGAGWNRLSMIPVTSGDEVVAAYLALGSVPAEDDLAVRTNSDQRIASLCDLTRLLITRWRNQDQLVRAANTDSLTGVANRDGFSGALDRVDGPYAVLYIDVDEFKEINDRCGHACGDQVLVEVARRIVASCRPDDFVARFGGDEFVVLLRDVDPATAREIGTRLVAASSAPVSVPGYSERVTLSVGLAFSTGGNDPIDSADRAMLTAKRLGRDRLVSA